MPATLTSAITGEVPLNIVQTPKQDLLIHNGLNKWHRWDGISTATEEAGMRAYETDQLALALLAGGSMADGEYVYAYRWIDSEGVAGNLNALNTATCGSGNNNVQVTETTTAPARATHIQIFRSLVNAPNVLYKLWEETIAFWYTTLSGTRNDDNVDATISGNESIIAVNDDGTEPADGYSRGLPPWHMSACVCFKNRMWAAVPRNYSTGHVEVVNGSSAVKGVGTDWPTDGTWALTKVTASGISGPQISQRFAVEGAAVENSVSSVTDATTMTIAFLDRLGASTFQGTSSNFAKYAVYSPAEEYLKLCYSYIGSDVEPESWPAEYTLQCHAPGGAVTALIPIGSTLFIAKSAKIYALRYQDDPAEGDITVALDNRGCENQRCWVSVEGGAFVLDRRGIYAFSGGEPVDVSRPISDIFRLNAINWSRSQWFRASYDQSRGVVRFFVCLASSDMPKHALCFSHAEGRWWIEEYPLAVGSACNLRIAGSSRPVIGCEHAKMRVLNEPLTLDGITPATTGTLRGTVTSAGPCTLTDTAAAFPSSLADVHIAIVDGRGKGQCRRITSNTATEVKLLTPWLITPDTTSVYQIGGYEWRAKFSTFKLTTRAADTTRQYQIYHEPTDGDAHLFVKTYMNRNSAGKTQGSPAYTGDAYSKDGVTVRANDPDVKVNLKRKVSPLATASSQEADEEGYKRYQWDANALVKGTCDRFATTEMHGYSGSDPILIYSLVIDGVRV